MFYKTPHVRAYADGRPIAWLDDEASGADRDALLLPGHPPPVAGALIVRTDPDIGLTLAHVDTLMKWDPAAYPGSAQPTS